jgi:hypothetical protein
MRDEPGQAAAEYVGLIALAAALLLVAGAAVGLGEVGTAVASTVRTGICIVAGDVCRDSDARAAGLEPCTVRQKSTGGGTSFSIAVVQIGGSKGKIVATRSDGSVLVTETDEGHAGRVVGIGLEASPIGVDVGAEVGASVSMLRGKTWEFPDAAAAGRFLRGEAGDLPPTWHYGEVGGELTAEAKGNLAGVKISSISGSLEGAAGLRVGRGQTTVYARVKAETGAKVWLPGDAGRFPGPATGDLIAELTYEHGAPREIAFRRVGHAEASHVVDTVARLDLRDPENLRAAAGILAHGLPWTGEVLSDVASLVRLAAQRGTVERSVYDLRNDSSDFALAAKLGYELGLEHEHVDVERRLVAASAWTDGSQERVREDCVGVTTEPPEGTS